LAQRVAIKGGNNTAKAQQNRMALLHRTADVPLSAPSVETTSGEISDKEAQTH